MPRILIITVKKIIHACIGNIISMFSKYAFKKGVNLVIKGQEALMTNKFGQEASFILFFERKNSTLYLCFIKDL